MFPVLAGLALLVATSAPPKARWEQQWKRARAMTAALDFEGALPVLKGLVGEPEVPPGPRAEMLLELGITHLNLGDDGAASSAFRRALAFDPAAQLSPLAPPKAMQLLEQERAKMPPPEPAPAKAPVATVAPEAAAPPAPVEPAPEAVVVTEPAPASRWSSKLPFALTAVLGAGGLATGVALALESQRVAEELETTPHLAMQVAALQGQRSAFGVGAVVGYAVGGALLTLALVLLIRSL